MLSLVGHRIAILCSLLSFLLNRHTMLTDARLSWQLHPGVSWDIVLSITDWLWLLSSMQQS